MSSVSGRGIAFLERPVLTLRVLLFLKENNNANLSSMISIGWNKRTLTASLQKLRDVELIEVEGGGSFPHFEKKYALNRKGGYVANIASHLKSVLESNTGKSMTQLSAFPKGCLPVIVLVLREGWNGISNVIKELNISPNQAYRCLDVLAQEGILVRRVEHGRKRKTSSYSLSEKGIHIAVVADALDKALDSQTIGQ